MDPSCVIADSYGRNHRIVINRQFACIAGVNQPNWELLENGVAKLRLMETISCLMFSHPYR